MVTLRRYINSEIGEKLREIRKDRGYTQSYLADLAGIHENSLRMYENGQRAIPVDTLHLLATHLGIEPSEVIQIDLPDITL